MSVETLGPPNVVTSRGRGFRGAFDDAWRGITGTEVAWTFAAGLVFTIAHAYALNVAPGRQRSGGSR